MTEKAPLTIAVKDYAVREAEKEIAPLGLTDKKTIDARLKRAYERIRDQTGKQIMLGSLRAYAFANGRPSLIQIDAEPRHNLITQLAAWLDGKRSEKRESGRFNSFSREYHSSVFDATVNSAWIDGLHIEDADLAADLAAAKARIAELDARLADLETGGITIEGREAPELEAAISLYRAVASRPLPDGMTPAKALAERAEEFCKGLPSGAPARIAIVCNWQKEPGRKKK